MIEPIQYAARPVGWFAVEGAVGAAVAAFGVSQVLLLIAAGDNAQSWGAATVSSVAMAIGAGLWAFLVGVGARAVLSRLGRWDGVPVRDRGLSVLHAVGIGTAVPWIVLALVLGSWQATTITIVVAVAA
ncbi:MAG: hypothetical protein Q7T71_11170, partial [Herbiconiux sp.]|nr:hypothetical protein [Herbiconiux sp.]